MQISSQISGVYQDLLSSTILKFNPVEIKATCHQCNEKKYKPSLKCCTYHPFLPNYIVGKILFDDSMGAGIVRKKIQKRQFCLPIGVVPSVRYQVEFHKNKDKNFGRNADWLCPFYSKDDQNCHIWKDRGSVCTSFYCQSSYGKKGIQFWKTLENYLSFSEMICMEEALINADFSPRQVSDLLGYINRSSGTKSELLRNSIDQKKWKQLWNGYDQDIEAFYIKCFRTVEKMPRSEFRLMGGDQLKSFENAVIDAIGEIK